ncbi:MAG: T6SS phospholipase effector Tle1-like catalytic domain-containing protein [Lysobacter sp.]
MPQINDNVISPRVKAVENMVARARAKTGKKAGPAACSTCHVPLWMGFFFDGTNNHKDRDFPQRHSNVVALFDAHEMKPRQGIVRFYYEGCGTDFEFADRYERVPRVVGRAGRVIWEDRKGYAEEESTLNQAFGLHMDKRLEKALFEFESFVEDRRGRARIDEINVSAYGFSRGSATARAFVHWLAAHSKVSRSGNALKYDDTPLNIKFLGLFDTVESVGRAGDNTQPRLIKTSVPTFVEKCLHTVAAHELRDAFPVTAIGGNRYTQVVSPGAHSDIGGGYLGNEQARTVHLSRINLLQMHDHARGTGVPMLSLGEMRNAEADRWETTYRHSFDVPGEAHEALAAYMTHVSPQSGPMRDVLHAHMKWYWKWIDSGLAAEDHGEKFRRYWHDDSPDSDQRREELLQMTTLAQQTARTEAGRGVGSTFGHPRVAPKRDELPSAVERLLEGYVHDSQAGFVALGTIQWDLSQVDYYAIREVRLPEA